MSVFFYKTNYDKPDLWSTVLKTLDLGQTSSVAQARLHSILPWYFWRTANSVGKLLSPKALQSKPSYLSSWAKLNDPHAMHPSKRSRHSGITISTLRDTPRISEKGRREKFWTRMTCGGGLNSLNMGHNDFNSGLFYLFEQFILHLSFVKRDTLGSICVHNAILLGKKIARWHLNLYLSICLSLYILLLSLK